MRPRLQELVTEQLRTIQQQIADFQVLERQLRRCSNGSRQQRPHRTRRVSMPRQRDLGGTGATPLSIPRKGEDMSTSTLEPLTILAAFRCPRLPVSTMKVAAVAVAVRASHTVSTPARRQRPEKAHRPTES